MANATPDGVFATLPERKFASQRSGSEGIAAAAPMESLRIASAIALLLSTLMNPFITASGLHSSYMEPVPERQTKLLTLKPTRRLPLRAPHEF
jgi:hypothetical protein